jgi:hypothetical protein
LVTFAFVSQLTGDPRHLTLARNWLLTVASFGSFDLDGTHDLVQAHLLGGAAIAYDLLALNLSNSEANTVVAALSRNATELRNAGVAGQWWENQFLQNHNWINHAAVGLAALATQEDLPPNVTAPWLSYAVDNARSVQASLDTLDGTFHEGLGYSAYGMAWHLPFVSALQRITGTDLGDIGMLRGYAAARAHLHLPEAPHQYVLAQGDFYGFSKDDGLALLRYAATKFQDGVAQSFADYWQATVSPSTYAPEIFHRVFEFLYYDPSIPGSDYRAQPLDWFGSDLQTAVFRSSWEAGGLVFALKSGSFGGNSAWNRNRTGGAPGGRLNFAHDHADDNGFYLYGNGSWLAPEASGYYIGHPDSPGPQANKTVFHNSLLIDGAGQLGEGVRSSGDTGDRYPWFNERTSGIQFFSTSQDFGYTVGDGSKLYPSSVGLQQWERHALFVDRKWVVLRDVITASGSHNYQWQCHAMDGITREGRWLHGLGKNGQALGVAVVAPVDWALNVERQAPVNIQQLNPTGSVYSVGVNPIAPSANATFLTALVPTSEAAWDSRPAVTAVDDASPSAGLWIEDGSRRAAAIFSDTPTEGSAIGPFRLRGLSGVVEYAGNQVTRALLVQGMKLEESQRLLIEQGAPSQMLEVEGIQAQTLSLSGDSLRGPRIYAPRATQVLWNGASVSFQRNGDYVLLGTILAPPDGGSRPPAPGSNPSNQRLTQAQSIQGTVGCSTVQGTWSNVALVLVLVTILLSRRRQALRIARTPIQEGLIHRS